MGFEVVIRSLYGLAALTCNDSRVGICVAIIAVAAPPIATTRCMKSLCRFGIGAVP